MKPVKLEKQPDEIVSREQLRCETRKALDGLKELSKAPPETMEPFSISARQKFEVHFRLGILDVLLQKLRSNHG